MGVRSRQNSARRNRYRGASFADDHHSCTTSQGRHDPVARSRSESRAYAGAELRHAGQRRSDGAIRGHAWKDDRAKDKIVIAIRFTPPVEAHDAKFGWGAAD